MIHAPTLEDIRQHRNFNSSAMNCILIAPKFHKQGFDEIISRLEYLNQRSSYRLHFYCAGYGAYWNKDNVPDMEELNINLHYNSDQIPWAFSQFYFAQFVTALENETNWTYSGGTEILVLDKDLKFKNCIVFKIDKMISNKIIDNPNDIIEALIQQSKKGTGNTLICLQEVSKIAVKETITAFLEFLPKPIEYIWNIWEKGKYYMIVNLK